MPKNRFDDDSEDEYEDEAPKKRRKGGGRGAGERKGSGTGGAKGPVVRRKGDDDKRTLADIFTEEQEDKDRAQLFVDLSVEPSLLPPRRFCTVCYFFAKYRCINCRQAFVCSMRCAEEHNEKTCVSRKMLPRR
ncbi:unnamed protein product [Vitrella brassicaformis CCMP3155]|uniref:HIT-type domain-containing protein n=1 Tax=Vitrella brassicaformis (strain CCMP3155) TaxID=1169540 RepID=A0A0G4GW16_VITBC|nr:unnamed protein product [Vitrella brassicaformis CCMP3155]|mmetsp:Transcript_46408/g.115483  ORF Transcript_46408/g.115483 Transcript_46408/m.115483 type:complete len:133 (-) Transcript_46408:2279-2677(-)|eukprot:CEM35077.1 unnamed protein product [Vitrella brassicaformis CCMP3155]